MVPRASVISRSGAGAAKNCLQPKSITSKRFGAVDIFTWQTSCGQNRISGRGESGAGQSSWGTTSSEVSSSDGTGITRLVQSSLWLRGRIETDGGIIRAWQSTFQEGSLQSVVRTSRVIPASGLSI